MAAIESYRADPGAAPRMVTATAVRYLLEELAAVAPGKTVEVRVPPFGATQCIAGPEHTRGTPANVIEMSPRVWIELGCGDVSFDEAVASGEVTASGTRAHLNGLLPLV